MIFTYINVVRKISKKYKETDCIFSNCLSMIHKQTFHIEDIHVLETIRSFC